MESSAILFRMPRGLPRGGFTKPPIKGRSGNAMTKRYHKFLTIAGSDSGGGAGIQADLKTASALGCYGMSVITALTAQNTKGVTAIHAVPPEFVEAQIEAVFDDMGVDAVKIGMLFSPQIIEIVARRLKRHGAKNIVLDPVMVAQSGDSLITDEAVAALKDHLLPMARIVKPNIPEASRLLGRKFDPPMDLERAAREIASYGCESVLVTGGHAKTSESNDVLYIGPEDRMVLFKEKRVATNNNHGTGCTLSSAIAGYLAKNYSIEDSVREAKAYITKALQVGADYRLGQGHGPVHHFHEFW